MHLIPRMAQSGLVRIFVGVETSSTESGLFLNKGIKPANFSEIKPKLAQFNIVPHIGFMMFHPFATPEMIEKDLDFLVKNKEIHRFGIIHERTRIFSGTELYNKVKESGLLIERSKSYLGCDYNFSDSRVDQIYKNSINLFEVLGIAVLERVEHLFMTSFFIDNLVNKISNKPSKDYKEAFDQMMISYDHYEDLFIRLFRPLIKGDQVETDFFKKAINELWSLLEEKWQQLLLEASKNGLEKPLEWLPSGDCNPEFRDKKYDGRLLTTRSGKINV
jgi:radical SAM superfamily enzyme YgiQ (UPF0313 family)